MISLNIPVAMIRPWTGITLKEIVVADQKGERKGSELIGGALHINTNKEHNYPLIFFQVKYKLQFSILKQKFTASPNDKKV